jgi:HSP20 family protein
MDLIRWTPFHDIDKFFDDDFFSLVPAVSKTARPSMDVYQTKDDVVAEVQLAGVDPKDVKVTIENDILTVRGEMKKEKETKEKDYYCKEIRSGSFVRSISLPVHVKGDKARAESKDGLLKITIPKAEKGASKQIPVKVKK